MNPDNDNDTLDLNEVEAEEAFQDAIRRGDWVQATRIQDGDLRKGEIPAGFTYRVTKGAKDER